MPLQPPPFLGQTGPNQACRPQALRDSPEVPAAAPCRRTLAAGPCGWPRSKCLLVAKRSAPEERLHQPKGYSGSTDTVYLSLGSILLPGFSGWRWLVKAWSKKDDNCLLTVTGNRTDPIYLPVDIGKYRTSGSVRKRTRGPGRHSVSMCLPAHLTWRRYD